MSSVERSAPRVCSATTTSSPSPTTSGPQGPTMQRGKAIAEDGAMRVRSSAKANGIRFDEIVDGLRFKKLYTPEMMAEARRNGFIGKTPTVAEQPLILSARLKERLVDAGWAVLRQIQNPAAIAAMLERVPSNRVIPGLTPFSSWAQIDFAITQDADGTLAPKLIELQGFPSTAAGAYFYNLAVSEQLEGTELGGLSNLFDYTPVEFANHLTKVVCGTHDPERVVMLDIDPFSSITAFDFAATSMVTGVDAVKLDEVYQRGNKLFRMKDGRELPVDRIYNRLLFHDLHSGVGTPRFDLYADLDVEWTPHPTWQDVWSKQSMVHLEHPSVPRTRLLSEVDTTQLDLAKYVVKPLDAYSGKGFIGDVTPEVLADIPTAQRAQWCIQEKVVYAPFVPAVDGGSPVRAEVRLLFLRGDDDADYKLATTFSRLSRGAMMNTGKNSDRSTGYTAVLFR